VIGVVGVIEDASTVRARAFPAEALSIVQFGENHGELGGSEYLKTVHGLLRGRPPRLDLAREAALQRLLVDLGARRLLESAHDCSEGGLAVTLAECCFDSGGIGAEIVVPAARFDGGVDRIAATLFGESATRVVAAVRPDQADVVLAAAAAAGVPAAVIGRTGGSRIRIRVDDRDVVDCAVSDAEETWANSLSTTLDGRAA
jgi:phosphoribosylformylglycinamidine synthase